MLDKNQLASLEGALDRRERELLALVARLRGELGEPSGDRGPEVRDGGEEGQVDTTTTRELGDLDRTEHEIADISAARLRMREGSYGFCDECGIDIPFARLQAVPTARYCIQHEEEHEKRARLGFPGG